jgi:hypothetical protein
MKLYPFEKCCGYALYVMQYKGGTIYQQFICEACGTKQTMEQPNIMFETGECEECKHITNIKKNGCNYMASFDLGEPKLWLPTPPRQR